VNFFEDEGPTQVAPPSPPPPTSSRRKPRSKRYLRVQRLVILVIALFVVVFLLALWVRSCQHNRKVGGYREYFDAVQQTISDSNAVGADLRRIILNPTKYTRAELTAKLDGMVKKQNEIASRAQVVAPPDRLKTENTWYVQGMRIRARGMRLVRDAIIGALNSKGSVTAAKLSQVAAYFTGPDVYYMELVYTPAQRAMQKDGVSGVTVPRSTYYLSSNMFDLAKLKFLLKSIAKSTNLTGVHGVALVSVTLQSGGSTQRLEPGRQVQVKASADMVFVIAVSNQGTVTERTVPVTLKLQPPGNAQAQEIKREIDSIAPNKTVTVQISGFDIPPSALGRVSKLTAKAGPVPAEHLLSNNSAFFNIILKL